MADRRRDARLRPHGAIAHREETTGLTAAAQLLTSTQSYQRPHHLLPWQDESWAFYESLGEFNYGVEWFGEAMSRVRLGAAIVSPGGDEPEMIDDGPAAELITKFLGGTDGQAQALRSLAVQLSVPGDAYLVGRGVSQAEAESGVLLDAEPDEYGHVWTVQPVNTMRRSRRSIRKMMSGVSRGWDIQIDEGVWMPLPHDALVCRVWDRNERLPWQAMSPARAALPIMREIDMYNRHIIAVLISRVAMNGMMLIPDEVTLPANPQYEDQADPFIAEMLDIMTSAIKNPGSPAAAAPMPVRIPAEMIEKFKHFTFATPLDSKIFEHREQALKRLAATLNLPAEIVTGMGSVNHWSSWQLSEDAIKIHISPKAEIITRCLTLGYLHPALKAMGEDIRKDGRRIIVWYDTSELTQRPDRSENARRLREMMIISDEACRRENGFSESDAPTDDDLEKMVLMKLAVQPQTAVAALKELTGLELQTAPAGPDGMPMDPNEDPMQNLPTDDDTNPATKEAIEKKEPGSRDDPPPPPDDSVVASARRDDIVKQSHSVRRRARQALVASARR